MRELLDDHVMKHGGFTREELAEAHDALYEATSMPSELMVAMTYKITAKAWEHGWELHIEGVGVTQSEGVEDAEAMVRHYLELEGLDSTAQVDITFEPYER